MKRRAEKDGVLPCGHPCSCGYMYLDHLRCAWCIDIKQWRCVLSDLVDAASGNSDHALAAAVDNARYALDNPRDMVLEE